MTGNDWWGGAIALELTGTSLVASTVILRVPEGSGLNLSGMFVASAAFPLSLAVVVAFIYLGLLRLLDLNEKEPLWGLGLALTIGVFASLVLSVLVDETVLELTLFESALAKELAIFLAVGVSFGLFESIGRLRGWSEVNGLLDGLVYGAAVGLGFATGEALVRELVLNGLSLLREPGEFSTLWKTLLAGLAYGVFGALVGSGFGAAVDSSSALGRAAYPLAGFAAAFLVHVGYLQLATGNALGAQGEVRAIVALVFPLALMLALIAAAQTYEGVVLREQLQQELSLGIASQDELTAARSSARRRRIYVEKFLKGDFDGWIALRTLHNRLVQLALVKARIAREHDAQRRQRLEREVDNLRAGVAVARKLLAEGPEASRRRRPA
jgi:hypothetical protein